MVGKGHMSIGEVLTELKEEFPDVTVSKIRFLESEGLISPERTASGYRKFSEKDVDRLRFILTLQRDSYLPLKVIRERLAEYDGGEMQVAPAPAPVSVPATAPTSAPSPPAGGPVLVSRPVVDRVEGDAEEDLAATPPEMHLSEADLANATGLDTDQVRALREYGVLCEHSMNGIGSYYDQNDLMVGRIARDFLKYGIEARHLRMFRHFAEREAALFEQVVLPAMRHRSPDARREAQQSLVELARLGRKLRLAFLRQSLRQALGGNS